MIPKSFSKVFDALQISISKVWESITNFHIAPKNHTHKYLKNSDTAKSTYKLNNTDRICPKNHKHNYIKESTYTTDNVSTLNSRPRNAFALEDHEHDFEKGIDMLDKKCIRSARSLMLGFPIKPQSIFASVNHSHTEYVRYGERIRKAKKLQGKSSQELAKSNHTHSYITANSPFKKKDATAKKAKQTSKGKLYIISSKAGTSGTATVKFTSPRLSIIDLNFFADLAGLNVNDLKKALTTSTPNVFDTCMSRLVGIYHDGNGHALTKYVILFVPAESLKKTASLLRKCAIAIGTTSREVKVDIPVPFRIIDAERKSAKLSDLVAYRDSSAEFWIPLVPPIETNILSFIDQIIYLIGVFFIMTMVVASIIASALLNAFIDGLRVALLFTLVGAIFYPILGNLCVNPIGAFRSVGRGIMIPLILVQKRRHDKPNHWLAPDRVYGLTIIPKNIKFVVNKQRIKISQDETVTEAYITIGGPTSDLNKTTQDYFRTFEEHYPIPYLYAQSIDSSGYNNQKLDSSTYLGRYIKFMDPRTRRVFAGAAGSELIAYNQGFPYVIVCFSKPQQ